jgi:hypothetical protein
VASLYFSKAFFSNSTASLNAAAELDIVGSPDKIKGVTEYILMEHQKYTKSFRQIAITLSV